MAIVIHEINGNFYAYEHYKENGKVRCVYLYPVESKEKLKLVRVEPGQSEYKGMNYYAAKELNQKFSYSENTIVIDKSTRKDEITTIRHEIAEREVMKHRGMKYKEAHEYANDAEKLDKPEFKKKVC